MIGKPWVVFVIGLGLVVGLARPGQGQGLQAPAPGADLERLSRRMADAVRDLADDLGDSAGRTPDGQYLVGDARELQRSTGDWFANLRGASDPYAIRRSYSGLDVSWHRLRGRLDAPGVMSPAVADEVRRVEQVDAQIHQALGLNTYPPNSVAPQVIAPQPPPPPPGSAVPPPPPGPAPAFNPSPGVAPVADPNANRGDGLDEVRRLAYALAQRGEAFASACQGEFANEPTSAFAVRDSAQLARMVDGYYDALSNPQGGQPPDARATFVPIVRQSKGLGSVLGTQTSYPPGVRAAWEAYTPALGQLCVLLDLNYQTPDGLPPAAPVVNVAPNPVVIQAAPVAIAYNPVPTAQVGGWAEQLDRQVDDLIAHFAPTARVVPDGGDMLDDMGRLRRDVIDFRRDIARGLDAGRLAREFHEVDEDWQRLARRVDRVARARNQPFGPNIQRVQEIGQTCRQIHQVLGMPGYPPVFGP